MCGVRIDSLRAEANFSKIRKTTFTPLEIILISYTLFWDLVMITTNNFHTVPVYTALGNVLTVEVLIGFLSLVSFLLILAGVTKNKPIRYVALLSSTCLWLIISSSIWMEPLNVRGASVILAAASAYQFFVIAKRRF